MHQNIIDTLFNQYQEKGFVSEDSVFDALTENELPLDEIDAICEVLLLKGIIIRNEIFEPDEDAFYDRSQIDYEKVFVEVVAIEEEMAPFIEQVRQIKPPQQHEWQNLIVQAKGGNSFARQRIIEMYLKIVVRIAVWHHRKYGISLAEAIQNGCHGLVMAYEKFEIDKQDNFSTYAPWWIRQYIMREATPSNALIYYPAHYKEKIFAIYEIYTTHNCERCNRNYVCPALLKKIISKLDCSQGEAESLVRHLLPMKSIELLVETDELVLSDGGIAEEIWIDVISGEELSAVIVSALATLTTRERQIIELRFGLLDDETRTLEEVGQNFNVTRERIRQIEAKALRKLQHPTRTKHLKPFY